MRALLADLELDGSSAAVAASDQQAFSMLVPRAFAARMRRGDACDPLLRQVLPTQAEDDQVEGFVEDPLRETDTFSQIPALVHKYHGRALLIAAPECAVHCRYCFRRAFPYQEHRPKHLDAALAAVQADPSISELILSGGDPLLMSDQAWSSLLQKIDRIAHVIRLRIHTRMPIVLPARITEGWLKPVQESRFPVTVVIHCNHVNELDADTERAVATLRACGVHVLNQAVLLRGVNDTCAAQVALCEGLFAQGVLPYYLHLPDQVAGTAHFYVDTACGTELHEQMRRVLPGYLLPKLVREVPGEPAKQILSIS